MQSLRDEGQAVLQAEGRMAPAARESDEAAGELGAASPPASPVSVLFNKY